MAPAQTDANPASYPADPSISHNPRSVANSLLARRQGPSDEDLPYPPQPYTPSVPLHASTIPYVSSLPTSTSAATTPNGTGSNGPMSASLKAHGTNVGLLVGAVLASAALLLIVAGTIWYMIKRRAGKLRSTHPRFSMFNPYGKPATKAVPDEKLGPQWTARPRSAANADGQFVFISNSEGDLQATGEKQDIEEASSLELLGRIRNVFEDDTALRRHSSPGALEEFARDGMDASTSVSQRPTSLPPLGRDVALYIQRQKAAELAQIMRMRIIRTESSGASSSRSSVASEKRRSVIGGLGVVHEEDEEVDIASTALSALDGFGVSVGPASPTVPISELFHVNDEGKIVRLSLASSRPASGAWDGMPKTSSSPSQVWDGMPRASPSPSMSSDGSGHSDDSSGEDLNGVVMCVGRAHSMDFKKPILISVETTTSVCLSPPSSHSAPLLKAYSDPGPGANVHRSHSAAVISAFPEPPPMLSPILVSPTSFSEDISHCLEERVFQYREAGPWSKAQYKLTTPGQIRALAESLSMMKPAPQHEQDGRAWPWPATHGVHAY